jgi:iodotyrosine deiodinase
MTAQPVLEPLPAYRSYPPEEMAARAKAFHADLVRRRTVRDFDSRPVPRDVIESCLLAAGTAPSGANLQPWHFAVIEHAAAKRRIRSEAEIEERAFTTAARRRNGSRRWRRLAPTPTSRSWKKRRC